MPEIHVVLHPLHPPAVETLLRGIPKIVARCPADEEGGISAHNAGDSPGFGGRWGAIFAQNLSAFAGTGDWSNRVTEQRAGAR